MELGELKIFSSLLAEKFLYYSKYLKNEMKKERVTYDSLVDALVNISKRLSMYEEKYNLVSENFYYKYTKGDISDDNEMIEWANDYQHYIALKTEIEKTLKSIAS